MHLDLSLHPRSVCPAVGGIEVDVSRPAPGQLALTYRLNGEIGRLRLPPPATSLRRDGLWRRTCFEAFIREAQSEAYVEFNFSPSGEWAAYRFTGYRDGMAPALEIPAPRIETRAEAGSFILRVWLEGLVDTPWRLGLSGVIEAENGDVAYWALAHPPGKPDFHHSQAFSLQLPPPDAK
jgi:hypothetical protein